MSAGRVLGYIVASRADGALDVDYAGPIEATTEAAQVHCTEPGDFVVAVCEVEP